MKRNGGKQMAEQPKLSSKMTFRMEEDKIVKKGPNLSGIISMNKPALEEHTTPVTKKQKLSYVNYWGSFCAAYNIDYENFWNMSDKECVEPNIRTTKRWKEIPYLAGFASYLVVFLREKNQTSNRTAHAERDIGAVRGYYRMINGIVPGKDYLVDYGNTIMNVLKSLWPLSQRSSKDTSDECEKEITTVSIAWESDHSSNEIGRTGRHYVLGVMVSLVVGCDKRVGDITTSGSKSDRMGYSQRYPHRTGEIGKR